MKKLFLILLIATIFLTACANTGQASKALSLPTKTSSYETAKKTLPVTERVTVPPPSTITKEVTVGKTLVSVFGTKLGAAEFGGMQKQQYIHNGVTKGAYEYITFNAYSPSVQTGLSFTNNIGDLWNDSVFVPAAPHSMSYFVELLGGIPMNTSNDTISINFLGIPLEFSNFNTYSLNVNYQGIKTYRDGDEFIGEDLNNPIWVWDLTKLNDGKIGIRFNLNLDDMYETDSQRYKHPLLEKEFYEFPNNYVKVMHDGINLDDISSEYNTIQISTTENVLINNGTGNYTVPSLLKITSFYDAGRGFLVDNKVTDRVYLYYNPSTGTNTLAYKVSSSRNVVAASNTFQVLTAKDAYSVSVQPRRGSPLIISLPGESIVIGTSYFANLTTGINYTTNVTTDIANWIMDTRTTYGAIIKHPSYSFSNPFVPIQISIPQEQVKGIISLIGKNTASQPIEEDLIPAMAME